MWWVIFIFNCNHDLYLCLYLKLQKITRILFCFQSLDMNNNTRHTRRASSSIKKRKITFGNSYGSGEGGWVNKFLHLQFSSCGYYTFTMSWHFVIWAWVFYYVLWAQVTIVYLRMVWPFFNECTFGIFWNIYMGVLMTICSNL